MFRVDNITGDKVTDTIISKLIKRQAQGQKDYNVTLADNTIHDSNPLAWIEEMQEELLDAIQYLEKYKQVTSKKE